MDFIEQHNVEFLYYPPYSRDLNPKDFFTFMIIKNGVRGQSSIRQKQFWLYQQTSGIIDSRVASSKCKNAFNFVENTPKISKTP